VFRFTHDNGASFTGSSADAWRLFQAWPSEGTTEGRKAGPWTVERI
jgi:hypothetical protein